jgi:hypothetical protein
MRITKMGLLLGVLILLAIAARIAGENQQDGNRGMKRLNPAAVEGIGR